MELIYLTTMRQNTCTHLQLVRAILLAEHLFIAGRSAQPLGPPILGNRMPTIASSGSAQVSANEGRLVGCLCRLDMFGRHLEANSRRHITQRAASLHITKKFLVSECSAIRGLVETATVVHVLVQH